MRSVYQRRVVVTGMGVISPVGNTLETFWDNLVHGRSGITPLRAVDPEKFSSKIAGQVLDFNPEEYFDAKEARRTDRFLQFAVAAADQAIAQSRLDMSKEDPTRVGVYVGSGIGGLATIEQQYQRFLARGQRGVSPFFIPMMIVDMAAGVISIRHGMKGPNVCVVTACATAAHSIGMAFRSIKFGDAEVCVAGGSEAAITDLGVSGFCSMNALSTGFNDEPARASRPFDAKRDGFVIAEGAGVVVLEELEHALARNAPIFGEILSVGMSGDAYHMAAPEPEGRGAEQAMRMAFEQAGITPDEVQYINAHGTSTPLGDISEVQAVQRIFGSDTKVMMCSTKSMTGHTLGAAGGIELVATCLVLERGIVPPTINQEEPDARCNIDCVPNEARAVRVETALSNSFGFGGHNATIIVRRFRG
ncbi:MAG: beta-ketoacyl-ACP synthase II [bacterium]|nr:beta-ketoacyl-ACP synthase II [bacterium]